MTEGKGLQGFIERHRVLFVLTGAGCSTRSGIPDYRDADGHWKRTQPVTYQAFMGEEATRLRPILMTTAAMVVGMIPLIAASGAGARSRFDIGLTIFAGMSVGTLFTLFVTPMVYTFLARDHAAAVAAGLESADVFSHEDNAKPVERKSALEEI